MTLAGTFLVALSKLDLENRREKRFDFPQFRRPWQYPGEPLGTGAEPLTTAIFLKLATC